VLWDKQVTLGEAILLLVTYGVYLLYTLLYKDEAEIKDAERKLKKPKPKIVAKDIILLVLGLIGLVLGAKYLIDALVNLSEMLDVATGVIAITAVAIGTSLPELLVSAKAAFQKKSEIALGNIFGSNVFNALVVVGLPGLFYRLPVDSQTFMIGLPTLGVVTLLFVISGISKRIHLWEGAFFLAIYILFIAKLFNWF
jgi:cation:H+ antiporter